MTGPDRNAEEDAARLSLVTIHTRTKTPQGPDFCEECSSALSEWVPWPCAGGGA